MEQSCQNWNKVAFCRRGPIVNSKRVGLFPQGTKKKNDLWVDVLIKALKYENLKLCITLDWDLISCSLSDPVLGVKAVV